MTAVEFRRALKSLGVTALEFGRFLDLDERTVRRWWTGERPVPRSVELLLLLIGRQGLTIDQVDALAGP